MSVTINSLKQIAYFLFASELLPALHFPCTKKREPRSAFNSIDTFWRILWQSERISSSLHISFTYSSSNEVFINSGNFKLRILVWSHTFSAVIIINLLLNFCQESNSHSRLKIDCNIRYLTNSNINCFSSKCLSSFLESRWGRWWWLVAKLLGLVVEPDAESLCEDTLKNVGVPSIVFTIGFNKPPRSNSCAEIFL